MITWRLEAALPKARILEIYLNVIEWGDGVWGADAAARTYFGIGASGLTRDQAGLLAAAIRNPRGSNPARPSARLAQRQQMILARIGGVEPPAAGPVTAAAVEPTPVAPASTGSAGEADEVEPAPAEKRADPSSDLP
jgi:membrane peptidoglycan carboxypeptidase